MLHCSATVHPLPEMNPLAPPLSPNFLLIGCSYWGGWGFYASCDHVRDILYLWPSTMFGLLIFCFSVHENTLKRTNAVHYLPLIKSSWSSGLLDPVVDPVSTKCVWVPCSFSAATIWLWEQQADFWLRVWGPFQTMNHIPDRWTMAAVRCTWTSLWRVVWTLTFVETPLCHGPAIPVRDHRLIALIICLCLLAERMMQWDISISWK